MLRDLMIRSPRDLTSPSDAPMILPPTERQREKIPPLRSRRVRLAVTAAVLSLALVGVLLPAARVAYASLGGQVSLSGVWEALGRAVLSMGLPPTDRSPLDEWGILVGGDGDTTYPESTTRKEPDVTTDLSGEDTSSPPDEATTIPPDAITDPPDEATTEPPDEPPDEPTTEPPEDVTADTPSEDVTAPDLPVIPEGCVPIVTVDASMTDRGCSYLVGDVSTLPTTLPTEEVWGVSGVPSVLILSTHPYEGYSDENAWYDPLSGGLAQVENPSDPSGVSSLAGALAAHLRAEGVRVIHLQMTVREGETAGEIYLRAEQLVRRTCALYPEIGLVLDLGRCAELTATGGIVRTEGCYEGEAVAQVQISVSGGRMGEVSVRDLSVAQALREALWRTEPTVSRPVRVKSGAGLVGDVTHLRVLSLELGAAGNTYAEATRLVPILGDAIADLCKNSQK